MRGVCLVAALMLSLCIGCATRLAPPEPDEESAGQARRIAAEVALDEHVEMIERVLSVANRLRIAGVPMCGKSTAPLLGIELAQRGRRDAGYFWELYLRTFQVERDVTVTVMDPASPAAAADVRSGDQILAVNGTHPGAPHDVFELLRDEPDPRPRLMLGRVGRTLEVELQRVPACSFEVGVEWTQVIRTGRLRHDHAGVSVGMVRFVENDDELAVVIGHELAHRILGGRDASYPENELKADELGLYLTARAGYDESVAPAFWERFALEKPWMIRWETDSKRAKEPAHARVAERLLAMPVVLERIARLRGDGQPILPAAENLSALR